MLISGGMDKRKWGILIKDGILTNAEVTQLKKHGSPGVVLMSWAVHILRQAVRANEITDRMAAEVEGAIITVRGLAAKQIAYTITQIPLVYFHIMTTSVHVFLGVNSWESAIAFTKRWLSDCTEADDDGFQDDGLRQCHTGGALVIVVGQLLIIYLFIGLWMAAVWMADPMGTQVANYDLLVDLQNLWMESLNCIVAMLDHSDIEVPDVEYTRSSQQFAIIEAAEEPGTQPRPQYSSRGTNVHAAMSSLNHT